MRPSLLVPISASLIATSLLFLAPPAQAAADGCATGVPVDFNGDGRTDAAIGNATASEGGQAGAGRVTIRYGDSDGLVGEGTSGNIRADTGDSPAGLLQTGAAFGSSLATADLDCDGYTDLVIGAPLFDNTGAVDSGSVSLLYGGPSGFTATSRQQVLISDDFGKLRTAGDRFGFSVDAVEDLGQGGTPDPDAYGIIIGVPYRDSAGQADSGAVATITALDGGSSKAWFDQETPAVDGGSEAGDLFGFSVAFGQFDTGSTIDALVGAPGEDIGSVSNAGTAVRLNNIYGDELTSGNGLNQNSAGVPGGSEAGDQFGYAVDAWTDGSTTRAVVSAPFENLGKAADAGIVQLFAKVPGSTFRPGISLNQDTSGVEGVAETGDQFGFAVALGAGFRAAVGVPGEDSGPVDCGLLQLVPLAAVSSDVAYTQNSAGVPGTASAGERLGSAVAMIDGAGENVALAGAPADVENVDGFVTVFPYTTGAPRGWVPLGVGGGFGNAFGSQGR